MPEIFPSVLADGLVMIHAGYLIYLVVGGFGAWFRPVAFWPHLVAVVWALAVVAFSIDCPLTEGENQLREAAGEQPYAQSFLDYYVAGLVYPAGYEAVAAVVVALVVLISWIPPGLRARRRLMRHYGGRTRPISTGVGRDCPSDRAFVR